MTLRPEYSLGRSEYNAFLFAAVGEEKTGMQLTVQTALIRLGIDPWQEAARLSDLSKAAAVQALTAVMARLPEGDWNAAALPAIAARLVGNLPGRTATPAAPPTQGQALWPALRPAALVLRPAERRGLDRRCGGAAGRLAAPAERQRLRAGGRLGAPVQQVRTIARRAR